MAAQLLPQDLEQVNVHLVTARFCAKCRGGNCSKRSERAAGGFNLGGASSAAATPVFGQAPAASQGFGFGASGPYSTCSFP